MIPIIDIFAGPGGLGEGFSSLINEENNERVFQIKLSIEKDSYAHQTLKLRSFFRQFDIGQVPDAYYQFVKGRIKLNRLYELYPEEAQRADEEAWCATLGVPDAEDTNGVTNEEVDERIQQALEGEPNWVLIGGPPCQAYSIVGRSRRKETTLDEIKDKRVGLYKEYLRIIAVHKPAIFIMENVKGLLSAQTATASIFQNIKNDLSDPVTACLPAGAAIEDEDIVRYRIFSLTTTPQQYTLDGNPELRPQDFIIKAEEYGIPQKRHRVILLGIREDMPRPQQILVPAAEVSLASVIGNLPPVRSGLSREFDGYELIKDSKGKEKRKRKYKKLKDSRELWLNYVLRYNGEINTYIDNNEEWPPEELPQTLGANYIRNRNYLLPQGHPLRNWLGDERLGGVLHHESRKHMAQDLKRYIFAARYAQTNDASPKLEDYRQADEELLPEHENATTNIFTDRFRIQRADIPATTVTSHISKDGHYFIHYDPRQARSFTVREAARVQTFPDNYYFCGGRTQQFHQVGNAVPPYLAYQIASIVNDILNQHQNNQQDEEVEEI